MKSKHKLQLRSTLAKGTVAHVFKGTYDGNCCAIKAVSSDAPAEHCRLLAEAQLLQACDHRGIIKFKALCRIDQQQQGSGKPKGVPDMKLALVLEYAEKGSICQLVHKQMVTAVQLYNNAQALQWALDIASALEYLHRRHPAIIHRDVKLSNMLCCCSERGQVVAKLSDFGLHRVASSPPDSALQSITIPHGSRGPCSPLSAAAPDSSQGNGQGCLSLPSSQLAAEVSHDYSEVHDASGRMMSYTRGLAGGVSAPTALQQQQQQQGDEQQETGSQGPGFSMQSTMTQRDATGAPSSPPPVEPLHNNVSAAVMPVGVAAAAVCLEAADRHGVSSNDWGSAADYGSMITDGTWVSDDTAGANSANNSMADACITAGKGSRADSSSCCDSLQQGLEHNGAHQKSAFEMTGQTGTPTYMAPEVFLALPYTEKVDVFSFGVALYELMTRSLLVFTQLPPGADEVALNRYAAKVAEGLRPPQPKKMSQELWELISWCWRQDPTERPCMSQVVAALEQLLIKEQQEQRQRSTCPSTIIDLRCSSCNSSSKMQPAPPAVEAAGQSSAHPQIASAQCSAAEEAELVPREAWCRCAIS